MVHFTEVEGWGGGGGQHNYRFAVGADKLGRKCGDFLSTEERSRLMKFIDDYKNQKERYTPCPCFSGDIIDSCHTAKKPYPFHFLCPCEKGTFDVHWEGEVTIEVCKI